MSTRGYGKAYAERSRTYNGMNRPRSPALLTKLHLAARWPVVVTVAKCRLLAEYHCADLPCKARSIRTVEEDLVEWTDAAFFKHGDESTRPYTCLRGC